MDTPDSKLQHKLLVVCLNSSMRLRACDYCAELGMRVDGCGNKEAAAKRFTKDQYEIVVFEQGALSIEQIPEQCIKIELESNSVIRRKSFQQMIRDTIKRQDAENKNAP